MLATGVSGEIEIRPSNSDVWTQCHAAPRIEAEFPKDDSNALEGTTAHWLAAAMLKHGGSPHTAVNYQHENGVIISEEMADAVQFYVEYVESTIGCPAHVASSGSPSGILFGVEEKLHIPDVHPDYEGTADFWVLHDDGTLEIVDLKYGWGLVEPYENTQTASYASGVVSKLPDNVRENLKRIKFTIVQPRPYHEQGQIRSWCTEEKDFLRVIAILQNAYLLASAPDALSKTGEHCKYCRGLADCMSARMAAMNAIDYSGPGKIENMTIEHKATELTILTRAEEALTWRRKALNEELELLAKSGKAVPGYSMAQGRGSTVWTEDLDTLKSVRPDLIKETLITPTKAKSKGVNITGVSETIPGKLKLERDGKKMKQIFAQLGDTA